MVVVAQGRFQIPQNVVKRVMDWGRSIKTVKVSVSVQGVVIAPHANLVKQKVVGELKLW